MVCLCSTLGAEYLSALGELDLRSPVPVIVYLAFAWLFLFLAHYAEAKSSGRERSGVSDERNTRSRAR